MNDIPEAPENKLCVACGSEADYYCQECGSPVCDHCAEDAEMGFICPLCR